MQTPSDEEYYTRYKGDFVDQKTSPVHEVPEMKKFLDVVLANTHKGYSVLEVGPGGFPSLNEFQHPTYMDVQQKSLDDLSDNARKINHDAEVFPWPFKENDFYLGVMIDVLSNIWPRKRIAVIKQLCRVCKQIFIADVMSFTPDDYIPKSSILNPKIVLRILKRNGFSELGYSEVPIIADRIVTLSSGEKESKTFKFKEFSIWATS